MFFDFVATWSNYENGVNKNMLPQRFWVFKNISFVKEKGGASKIKSGTKNLQNLPSMIYESVILELFILVLVLYSYCGDKR